MRRISSDGFVGFRVGIKSPLSDYRAAAIDGRGMNAGINADGRLFIGAIQGSALKIDVGSDLLLEFQARPSSARYMVVLRASKMRGETAKIRREVKSDWLTGGLALVCGSGPVEPSPVSHPQYPVGVYDGRPRYVSRQHLGLRRASDQPGAW